MATSAQTHQPKKSLTFEERLQLLMKSAGVAKIGDDTDKICREVRGKE